MLVNSCTGATNEKMALISSTNKQWLPQNDHNHIDDQNTYMDSNPSTVRVMEKPGPELNVQQQQQQQQLKCPRCDSSNTKFCYYNNYSLSQPRHFCKACKRYWTRGGTLRNVPVGGGCRKNKRIKRPFSGSSSSSTITTSTSSFPPSNSSNPSNLQTTQFDLSSNSNHMISPLFFGFSTNPSDTTLPYSGFDLNGLFSSGLISNDGDYNRNGFINGAKQIQDNIVRSNSSPFTSATMASVLASKFTNGTREPTNNIFQSYEEDVHNLASNESEMSMRMRDVKLEDAQTRLEWNIINSANNCQIQNDQIGTISDPSLYWNATSVGSNWLDPAPNSIGSSFQLL